MKSLPQSEAKRTEHSHERQICQIEPLGKRSANLIIGQKAATNR
jgi:hypothetical protein